MSAITKESSYRDIEVDGNGYITLTDSGMELASKILERHQLLTQFLIYI